MGLATLSPIFKDSEFVKGEEMPFSPALVLSAVIASIYGVLFHFIYGRTLKQLGIYWLAALVGFALGQVLAGALGWRILMIGEVHLLEGTIGSGVALSIAKRLKL